MIKPVRILLILLLTAAAVGAQDPEDDEQDSLDRPEERWRYFYDQRRYPGEELPEGARLEAYRQLMKIEREAKAKRGAAGDASWKLIGPRPVVLPNGFAYSGRVTSLAVDPRNNDVVYAGGADGGIWKTSDGGATWTPLTDDQPTLSIGAMALDPSNPDTIYVGTGEENFNGDAYTGVGILKSIDAGGSWSNFVGPFLRQRIGALAVHPSDGRTILAASNGGVYRSTDGGQTWGIVLTGVATSVFFDPNQPAIAWASLGNINGATINGVYRSTNAGATWTLVGGVPGGVSIGRVELVPVPSSRDTVLAAIGNPLVNGGSTLNGVYRTNDAGQHWTRLAAVPDFCNPQCWYDLTIRSHPSDEKLMFVGGIGLFRSSDGGANWDTLPRNGVNGAPHVDHHALVFTGDGTRFYDGNDGGVWSTETGLAASIGWKNLNATLALSQYYPSISIHPTDPNIGLGGSQDAGTHLYQGDLKWALVAIDDGGWTAIDPSSPNVAYGSFVFITLFRTQRLDFSDGISVVHGIDKNDRARFIGSYVLDPANPQRMYYGTYRLYRSVDGGGLWRAISPDLTNPPMPDTTSSTYTISTIAVAPSDSRVIYTGSVSGAVFGTRDGGTIWENLSSGLPLRSITHITVDPLDALTVYATFSGFASAAELRQGHVFVSRDGGGTWSDISGNLPNLPVNDVVIDPDLPDTWYIATDLGVMTSTDMGRSWDTLGNGLPRSAVAAIMVHRPSRILRAATHGRSMWDLALPQGLGARPVIQVLSPAAKNAGEPGFTLTIKGANFGMGTRVLWNGEDRRVTSAASDSLQVEIPATDIATVGRAAITVFNPGRGGGASIPAKFVVGPAPLVSSGGVVSSASPRVATAAPGSLLSIYGANFTGPLAQAVGFPLPETLGGVTVTIGANPAPIYFVSANQLNVQVPFETPINGPQTLNVDQSGLAGSSIAVQMARVAPAIFTLNQQGTGQGAIRIGNSAAVAAPADTVPGARPARRGETIEIYCTGLGAVANSPGTGNAASARVLSTTLLQPIVSIGGAQAMVGFSGLTPGVAGLYQVNAQIPEGIAAGDAVPVILTIAGVSSNTVTVAVE